MYINYYDILEISESASDEVIKAAYKALVKKYHPDVYIGDATVREKNMSEINVAYSVLSNATKKCIYDEELRKNSGYKQSNSSQDQAGNGMSNNSCYDADKTNKNPILGFFKEFGKSIWNDIERQRDIRTEAYNEGILLNDYELAKRYIATKGSEKMGYALVLEERGMIRKNEIGLYVYDEKFRQLFY